MITVVVDAYWQPRVCIVYTVHTLVVEVKLRPFIAAANVITILKDWYEDPPKIIYDENLMGKIILYYPNELGYIVLVLDKAHVFSILEIVPGSLIAANNCPCPLEIP